MPLIDLNLFMFVIVTINRENKRVRIGQNKLIISQKFK